MKQLDVFGGEARTREELTERQERVWAWIRETPGGLTADEIGARLHALRERRPHGADERCAWCVTAGRDVLRSKGLAPLVVRRRNGHWQPRDPQAAERAPTGLIATSEPDPDLNPFADL